MTLHNTPLLKKLKLTLVGFFCAFLTFGQALDVVIEDYTAIPSENFCVQFDVSNFEQIISSQYTLEWDPAVISFDSLTNIGLPLPENLFYNAANASMGQLLVNWFDPLGGGNDLVDNSTMFELCFTAVGPIGSSTTIVFTSFPLQIEVTTVPSGGEDVGIEFSGGTITIVEPLLATSTDLNQPDCLNPSDGSIEIEMTGGVDPYSYDWIGPGAYTADTEDIFNLGTGTYYLTVTDGSDPPIFYLDTFEIGDLLDVPNVMIAEANDITCINNNVTLDASGSSMGGSFDLIWVTVNGNIILNGNTLMPLVDAPGDYELIITNNDNGCSSSSTVTVLEDMEMPMAMAGMSANIDCNNLMVTLDGTGSSSDPEFSANWTTVDGNILSGENTFEPIVSGGGIYEIIVTDQTNGCTANDEVVVTIDTIAPIADAGMDQVLSCVDDVLNLDGSASSSGGNITYLWTTNDGNLLGANDVTNTQINQSGTYTFQVSNTENGCTASDFTMILLDEDLVGAMAGFDENLCEDSFQLIANLPVNNTGVWASTGNAVFENLNLNTSMVNELDGGINELVWTLSTADCPAYSSDTITLSVEDVPLANDDVYAVAFGENPFVLTPTENDGILTVSDFDLQIIGDLETGTLTEIPDGSYSLTYPASYFGVIEFEYSLCNTFCPEYCDTASVILNIQDEQRIDTTVVIPNGITANGDGINDTFVIPILEDNPEEFPENEMIIFNRWGNVVYQSKPYLNDWGGTNEAGKTLPQGTYYYVLRLNLAQGEIIKGEVTVLR